MLSEHKLSTAGERNVLIARHSRYAFFVFSFHILTIIIGQMGDDIQREFK